MWLVTAVTLTLVLVIVTALAFDFTNGFHDTANAMAASISTGALTPKVAVGLSAILNLVGAFLSVEVALTVSNAVVKIQNKDGSPIDALAGDGGQTLLLIVLAGLAGGILWNLFTWLLGLPSSSSHALLGGLTGGGSPGTNRPAAGGGLGDLLGGLAGGGGGNTAGQSPGLDDILGGLFGNQAPPAVRSAASDRARDTLGSMLGGKSPKGEKGDKMLAKAKRDLGHA